MTQQIKAGRKPISAKPKATNPYAHLYNEQTFLGIDPSLAASLKAEGKEWRFIDRKQFIEGGNRHRQHWTPYRVSDAARATMSVDNAPDADGFVVRKGLVLAVRPIELGDAHRDFIERSRMRLHGNAVKKSDGRYVDTDVDGDDKEDE